MNNTFTEVLPNVTVIEILGLIPDIVLGVIIKRFATVWWPIVVIFGKLLYDRFSNLVVN